MLYAARCLTIAAVLAIVGCNDSVRLSQEARESQNLAASTRLDNKPLRLTLAPTMTRDEIEGFILRNGDPHDGQGCGDVTFEGKDYGAYWNDYDIYISGFESRATVSLGYLLPDYRMFEFVGPGFAYRLQEGKFIRQEVQNGQDR